MAILMLAHILLSQYYNHTVVGCTLAIGSALVLDALFNHTNNFVKNTKIPGVNLIYLRNCVGY